MAGTFTNNNVFNFHLVYVLKTLQSKLSRKRLVSVKLNLTHN